VLIFEACFNIIFIGFFEKRTTTLDRHYKDVDRRNDWLSILLGKLI